VDSLPPSNGAVYVGSNNGNVYAIGKARIQPAGQSAAFSSVISLVDFEVFVINFFVPGFRQLTQIIDNLSA